MGGNWHGVWRVRPATVGFGSDYFLKSLRYQSDNGRHAYAHGKLFIDDCRPNCARAGYFANATAYFWHVFNHRGPGRNFGDLRLRWQASAALTAAVDQRPRRMVVAGSLNPGPVQAVRVAQPRMRRPEADPVVPGSSPPTACYPSFSCHRSRLVS